MVPRESIIEEINKVVKFETDKIIEDQLMTTEEINKLVNELYNDVYFTIDNISPNYIIIVSINVTKHKVNHPDSEINNIISLSTYILFNTGEIDLLSYDNTGILEQMTAQLYGLFNDQLPTPEQVKEKFK